MDEQEALVRRELIQKLALELLRAWGFPSAQLEQLFASQGARGRHRPLEDLEDAIHEAYAMLWDELQREKIQAICPETVRYRLLDALRRRGLDRKPHTVRELLVGIVRSRRSQTRRRYLSWAKYELQGELKERLIARFGLSDRASLERLTDYFLAEFVPRQYDRLNANSDAKGSAFDRLCKAFADSESDGRRALGYRAWITPICPRLKFGEAAGDELEDRAWTRFEEQPEYEALIALERLRYEDRLVRCQRPHDELTRFLMGLRNPAERRRLELCMIFAKLKRESRRSLTSLKAYMVYIFSHFPSTGHGRPPQGIPLGRVTLDMIQGCEFTWDEVCRRFSGGPRPGDYTTKRRIERDMIKLARTLGFIQETISATRGADNAV